MSEGIALRPDHGSDSIGALAASSLVGSEGASAVSHNPRCCAGRDSASLTNQFRDHPLDCIEPMTASVHETIGVLSGTPGQAIIGIGADTTGSPPAPIDANGDAVARFEKLYQRYLGWAAQAAPLHTPA